VPDDVRDQRSTRLHDVLSTAALRRELGAWGYDSRQSGQELARIALVALLESASLHG